jgi:alpha/beta superfamily hydrolase
VRSPPAAVAGEVEATVTGPVGPLEVRIHAPETAVRRVLLCHPHPLYGGSMHSPVPLAIARMLAERGQGRVAWARFNYRGVGASGGAYDEGRGEVDDARAVLDHLRRVTPAASDAPTTLCGHSFGSSVAYRAAIADGQVERLLIVSPSTRFLRFDGEPPARIRSTIFIGDRDELCDVGDAHALADRIGAEVRVFEGFDHHFLKSRRALAEAALSVIAPEVASP